MDGLTIELKAIIFSYFTVRDLCNAELVCKQFQTVARRFSYKALFLNLYRDYFHMSTYMDGMRDYLTVEMKSLFEQQQQEEQSSGNSQQQEQQASSQQQKATKKIASKGTIVPVQYALASRTTTPSNNGNIGNNSSKQRFILLNESVPKSNFIAMPQDFKHAARLLLMSAAAARNNNQQAVVNQNANQVSTNAQHQLFLNARNGIIKGIASCSMCVAYVSVTRDGDTFLDLVDLSRVSANYSSYTSSNSISGGSGSGFIVPKLIDTLNISDNLESEDEINANDDDDYNHSGNSKGNNNNNNGNSRSDLNSIKLVLVNESNNNSSSNVLEEFNLKQQQCLAIYSIYIASTPSDNSKDSFLSKYTVIVKGTSNSSNSGSSKPNTQDDVIVKKQYTYTNTFITNMKKVADSQQVLITSMNGNTSNYILWGANNTTNSSSSPQLVDYDRPLMCIQVGKNSNANASASSSISTVNLHSSTSNNKNNYKMNWQLVYKNASNKGLKGLIESSFSSVPLVVLQNSINNTGNNSVIDMQIIHTSTSLSPSSSSLPTYDYYHVAIAMQLHSDYHNIYMRTFAIETQQSKQQSQEFFTITQVKQINSDSNGMTRKLESWSNKSGYLFNAKFTENGTSIATIQVMSSPGSFISYQCESSVMSAKNMYGSVQTQARVTRDDQYEYYLSNNLGGAKYCAYDSSAFYDGITVAGRFLMIENPNAKEDEYNNSPQQDHYHEYKITKLFDETPPKKMQQQEEEEQQQLQQGKKHNKPLQTQYEREVAYLERMGLVEEQAEPRQHYDRCNSGDGSIRSINHYWMRNGVSVPSISYHKKQVLECGAVAFVLNSVQPYEKYIAAIRGITNTSGKCKRKLEEAIIVVQW